MEEKLIGEVMFQGSKRSLKMKENLLYGKFKLIEVAGQTNSLIVVVEIIIVVVVDAVEIVSNGVAVVDIINAAVEDAVFENQGYFVELVEQFEI